MDTRYGKVKWGAKGTRVFTAADNRKKPLKWNRWAGEAGTRIKVFCSSLSDVFEDWKGPILDHHGAYIFKKPGAAVEDRVTMDDLRLDLFKLIDATPNLDWQLLTKRPENVRRMWPENKTMSAAQRTHWSGAAGTAFRSNVWIGTSVAEQKDADQNIPELLKLHELAPVLFVSAEPLVGKIDLTRHLFLEDMLGDPSTPNCSKVFWAPRCEYGIPTIDWLICGGESGHHPRPYVLEYAWDILEQCKAAGVPFFHKQLGSNPVTTNCNLWDFDDRQLDDWGDYAASASIKLKHAKGEDMSEWPENLRVREFPKPVSA